MVQLFGQAGEVFGLCPQLVALRAAKAFQAGRPRVASNALISSRLNPACRHIETQWPVW